MTLPQATYDISKSYQWNYDHGPVFQGEIPVRDVSPTQKFLNFNVNSRIGVPAGPLLNSNWIKLYAELGFDLLAYKTVRSQAKACHPNPNCLYVNTKGQLKPERFTEELQGTFNEPQGLDQLSITNSFGIPSKEPEVWQEDVAIAKKYLKPGQILFLSVVGTPSKERDFVQDWIEVAAMAKDTGADIIEADISCPNVTTGEGEVFTDSTLSGEIAKGMKKAIGSIPLALKVGYFPNEEIMRQVVKEVAPYTQCIVGINTIRMKVVDENGKAALPGEGREYAGVCGAGIKERGLENARRLVELKNSQKYDMSVIGVGGVITPADVKDYFEVGVDAVKSATGAMWNPLLAYQCYERGIG